MGLKFNDFSCEIKNGEICIVVKNKRGNVTNFISIEDKVKEHFLKFDSKIIESNNKKYLCIVREMTKSQEIVKKTLDYQEAQRKLKQLYSVSLIFNKK